MAKETQKPKIVEHDVKPISDSADIELLEPIVAASFETETVMVPDMCNREELQIIADAAEARAKVVEAAKGPEFVYVVALRDIVESVRRLLEYNSARGHWGIENEGEEE